jgi:hypothetical protein
MRSARSLVVVLPARVFLVWGAVALGPSWARDLASTNLQLLPPRDRPQPQADRNERPHREAVPSSPGLSPLPRPVGLERLSVDNSLPVAASLRPKPSEAPHPIPSVCPVVAPGSPASGFRLTLSHCFAGRTSGTCRSSFLLSWCRVVWPSPPSPAPSSRAGAPGQRSRRPAALFQVRDDEPVPRVGAGLHRTP